MQNVQCVVRIVSGRRRHKTIYLFVFIHHLILQCLPKIKTSIDIPPATEDCSCSRDLEIDHSISRSFKFSSHIPNIAATTVRNQKGELSDIQLKRKNNDAKI